MVKYSTQHGVETSLSGLLCFAVYRAFLFLLRNPYDTGVFLNTAVRCRHVSRCSEDVPLEYASCGAPCFPVYFKSQLRITWSKGAEESRAPKRVET